MRSRAVTFAILVAASLPLATVARAADPSKAQCIASNEDADASRRAGRLRDARRQLLTCVAQSCPQIIRSDCAERLAEVDKAAPTIVFAAKGPDGADLTLVRVTIDGIIVAERLDGSAITVDPGEHTFELTTAGQLPVTKKLLLTEGVKGRQELVSFGALVGASTAVAPRSIEKFARIVVDAPGSATVLVDGSVVSAGRWEGKVTPGAHDIRVTEPGKTPFTTTLTLRDDESRTVTPTLESERSLLPYFIGGAVVVVTAASIGGYFLFKPSDRSEPPPTGKLGSVTLPGWKL